MAGADWDVVIMLTTSRELVYAEPARPGRLIVPVGALEGVHSLNLAANGQRKEDDGIFERRGRMRNVRTCDQGVAA
jgi:hypothetical protein